MAYTTIDKSSLHFNTKLYAGNSSSTQAVTGVGFQPDWVWIKQRNLAYSHVLFDAVRGVGKNIQSNSTAAEETNNSSGYLSAFDSDGFTLSQGSSNGDRVNGAYNYVGWNWKANGQGSSNTDGDITATVSANTTSGFSIVKYTGNGSTGATVGHGLGSTVKMVMCKGLGDTYGWKVFHTNLTSGKTLVLNTTAAEDTDANRIASANASTFTTSGTFSVNESGSGYVAYCFAEKQGFSKFGSYTGNNNVDGNFLYTGFKPAFIMIKRTNFTKPWMMFDNKRDGYNPDNNQLQANDSAVENTSSFRIDMLSNGFKLRSSDGDANENGNNFLYLAIAEAPLVGSNNVPATVR
jgi:hypothetical protein